ncbi:hypothetical protein FIBSPDRAFT_1041591 [Athelia psychrophila]|uniref:Uncharacterized protein n=1 Tax=Athelia psychrophila TaxID=1759441 RepID=A0A166NJW0_9AGAM|nr:hypothetical protein FIBSPDRAFT_1041591 [Fibularhizoctonia sp. CBS 109695]
MRGAYIPGGNITMKFTASFTAFCVAAVVSASAIPSKRASAVADVVLNFALTPEHLESAVYAIVAQAGFARLANIGGKNHFLQHILEIFAFFLLTGICSTMLLPETKQRSLEELSTGDQEGFVSGVAGHPDEEFISGSSQNATHVFKSFITIMHLPPLLLFLPHTPCHRSAVSNFLGFPGFRGGTVVQII